MQKFLSFPPFIWAGKFALCTFFIHELPILYAKTFVKWLVENYEWDYDRAVYFTFPFCTFLVYLFSWLIEIVFDTNLRTWINDLELACKSKRSQKEIDEG